VEEDLICEEVRRGEDERVKQLLVGYEFLRRGTGQRFEGVRGGLQVHVYCSVYRIQNYHIPILLIRGHHE